MRSRKVAAHVAAHSRVPREIARRASVARCACDEDCRRSLRGVPGKRAAQMRAWRVATALPCGGGRRTFVGFGTLEDAVAIPDLAYARARKQFLASACLASRLLAHDSKHPLDSVCGHGGNTVGIRDHVVASTHSDATTSDVIADRDDPGAAESVKRRTPPGENREANLRGHPRIADNPSEIAARAPRP